MCAKSALFTDKKGSEGPSTFWPLLEEAIEKNKITQPVAKVFFVAKQEACKRQQNQIQQGYGDSTVQ